MVLPTSTTWDLVDFNASTLPGLENVTDDDIIIVPDGSQYFGLDETYTRFIVQSDDGRASSFQLVVPVPAQFTLQLVMRCPRLPHNLGDLVRRHFGVTVADDAGRGFSLYFAKSGVAISPVGNFGAATALPDTSDLTSAIASSFFTLRIAVEGTLGRAYVFLGEGVTDTPALRWIIPVEPTPGSVGDIFMLTARGLSNEPVQVELQQIRLAGKLVLANYPPIADAGPDRTATVGSAVRFDGRASYDVEGAPITFRWQCVDAPYGSTYAADVALASTVDDGDDDGVTPIVHVDPSYLPEWLSPGDILRIAGGTFEISHIDRGEGLLEVTSDAIPDALAGPARFVRQSIVLDAVSPTPVAVPDVAGLYRFRLTVSDGDNQSEPAEAIANIAPLQSPIGVEPDVSIIWKAIGDEWQLIDGRMVFQEAWTGVAQILAGKLLEAWQTHYNTSIRDAQRVYQRKWVAYRTLVPETAPDKSTISPRYGTLFGTHAFEQGNAYLGGSTLVVDVVEPAGTILEVPMLFPADPNGYTAHAAATYIGAQLALAGVSDVVAELRGTRDGGSNLRMEGIGSTVDGGEAFTNVLLLDSGSWPVWAGPGDTLCIRGGHHVAVAPGIFGAGVGTLPIDLTHESFVYYRAARLALRGSRFFRVRGRAAELLGLPVETWNDVGGVRGSRITDRTYYVEGVDLVRAGVRRGDHLVVNNGETFVVDRIITDPRDPHPNQRVLLFDSLPPDTGAVWAIPSLLQSAEVDYEIAGAYPGDLAKVEVFAADTGAVAFENNVVLSQRGRELGVVLSQGIRAALMTNKSISLIGLKRRKAIPLPEDVVGIPTLQELIAARLMPLRYRENRDYILEPFYRDIGGRPIPMLQFHDHVFIDKNLEPPDILWAETTLFSNDRNVEGLFGRLVGFLRDDAASFPADFNYVSGVAGLLYAQQQGPRPFALAVGAQILLGQPFAEVAGYIEEIRPDYSTTRGRLLIRDDDGNKPTESETVRAYYYRKDPNDPSIWSGLARDPETDAIWKSGDRVPQFAPLGGGIEIDDIYTDPYWWRTYVASRIMHEPEKFHSFAVRYSVTLANLANISLLGGFLHRTKGTYNKAFLLGSHGLADDLDVDDTIEPRVILDPHESLLRNYRTPRWDDYRGDGTVSLAADDGVSRADESTDAPLDLISFLIRVDWPGGTLSFPTTWPFFLGTQVRDVGGAQTGTPGTMFSLSNGMTLAAGSYETTYAAKSGPVLPPL